jgi:amidohydrolase
VFQPGEEKLPGGASLMLNEGIFENVQPEHILALHVFPELEVGKVGLCKGQYMASADEIYITIKGKGGHGALPHLCIDPIVIASHVVVALQSLVSRNCHPLVPSVLTIGKINSVGGATKVLSELWMKNGEKEHIH